MLHGHERSITQIRYNREGDLLFSCAKDNQPNVWYAVNGERLGSFKGHTGAVWCLDVSCILLCAFVVLVSNKTCAMSYNNISATFCTEICNLYFYHSFCCVWFWHLFSSSFAVPSGMTISCLSSTLHQFSPSTSSVSPTWLLPYFQSYILRCCHCMMS